MLKLSDQTLFRQIIMAHYTNPMHRGLIKDNNSIIITQDSESCIDNLQLQVLIKAEKIVIAKFDGVGCAISTSASDILAQEILGKTINDAKKIINNYLDMLYSKSYDKDLLNELVAYSNVPKQPNRIRCAILGANGFANAISQYYKSLVK